MASAPASWLFPLLFLCSVFPFAFPATITIPLSPSTQHFPSSDPWIILNHLASLSLSRAHHIKSPNTNFSSIIKTPLFSRSYGGYSMSLSFGTPPQTIQFIMDTGSSLVWFPCTSRYLCAGCNFPNTDLTKIPKFMPKLSSSSKLVGCSNPKCAWIFGSNVHSKCQSCDPSNKNCTESCPPYIIQYGLGSTAGRLLLESLDFPNKTIADFLVGCSIISTRQPEGIAGFGRSSESLPLQLGLKKFSYCLLSRRFDDTQVSSNLILDMGPDTGEANTPGLSYTPFAKNTARSNAAFQEYYYVTLRKIIVGDHHVKIPYNFLVPQSDGNGGTIVDSGSTFTFMEGPVFELVAKAFEKQMANYTIASGVQNQTGLRPCFDISDGKSVIVPELIFKFKGGAKMKLPLANYFAFVDMGVICLTIVSDNAGAPGGPNGGEGPAIILGNFQQQNFYMEYDLENERFGFKQQSCA
ncbi:probable aspartyl protease At4g16563 [Manihot esculenta]|uniref:Peptidase A1 domain-containing protein n=1 Tax=Manihot esculenta TaxID=3983 RepID=A0A2C9VEW4_MANES|nr:probable aspartyl protease At4g16563 [Manihot esculenta]OAY42977.1 hypothetical protein MANES_08G032100v8 [Manihot esculenta]